MENWTVTASCGGRFPAVDPVFFSDRNRVAVASALAIKIFQLNTKQMVTKIVLDCTDLIQMKLINNEKEFLIVRKSGIVEKIGLDETEESTRLDSDVKVRYMVSEELALISNQRNLFEVGLVSFGEGTKFESIYESSIPSDGLVAFSANNEYAAFMAPKTGKIEVINLLTKKIQHVTASNRSTASSLAVNCSGVVAVGSNSGVIDMFYQSKGMRTLKWHLEPVTALLFAQNDEYLLSGGHEHVLVFWHLSTNRQQFLPRLDGYISSIAAFHNYYALTLDKSQLVVLSAVDLVSRLQVAGTRAEFVKCVPDHQAARRRRRKRKLDLWASSDYTADMQIHPGTRQAYLVGSNACAQVYSLAKDEQEQVLKLARTVDAGKVRDELDLLDPHVDLLRFSGNGKFMATVDTAHTPKGLLSSKDNQINLKFWLWDSSTTKWTVISRVENPHGNDIDVRDGVFDDDGTLITAGSDGSLRLWRINEKDNSARLKQIAAPFGTSTPAVSLAWSGDRSVLALAYETSIYLVDASRLKITKQIPNIASASIRSVQFASSSLVVLDKSRLTVFDMVSWSLNYSIELKCAQHGGRLLAVDANTNRFALAVNYWTPQYRVNSKIVQLSVQSPIPLNTYTHPFAVAAISLIPGTKSYCFLDQRGVLCTLAGLEETSVAVSTVAEQNSLVSIQASLSNPIEEVEGHAKSLDVNTMSKVFDSNATLEQMFDSVLTLVS